jgi:hypothetical protein
LSAAQEIVVNPQDEDQIMGFSDASQGEAIKSSPSTVGTTVELVAIDSANWLPIRKVGSGPTQTKPRRARPLLPDLGRAILTA